MIKSENPQVVFLSETKCHGDVSRKKFGIFKDWNLKFVDSSRLSRGLVLLWRKDVELKIIDMNKHYISARIQYKEVNSLWRVLFV